MTTCQYGTIQICHNTNKIPAGWWLHTCQNFNGNTYAELASLNTICEHVSGNTYRLKPINFPVAYNPNDSDFNEIGNSGGEKEHTLTVAEIASHNHTPTYRPDRAFFGSNQEFGTGGDRMQIGAGGGYPLDTIAAAGGSQPHNNLPNYTAQPYIVKAFHATQEEIVETNDGATLVAKIKQDTGIDLVAMGTSKNLYNENIATGNTINLSETWLNFKYLYMEVLDTPYIFNVENIKRDGTTRYGLSSYGDDAMTFLEIRFLSAGTIYCINSFARAFNAMGAKVNYANELKIYGIK